jgi:hypothetical protein
VPLGRKISIQPTKATKTFPLIPLLLLVCAIPGISQKPQPGDHSSPKYDVQTETKTKGVVDEINVVSWGTRKDFTELVTKNGEEKLHFYLCPKPFLEEMEITFNKGDEITVTGSKVKDGTSDVVLARQLARNNDTLVFRDDKGNPVWDPRTGK